jgi:hypothetical protein
MMIGPNQVLINRKVDKEKYEQAQPIFEALLENGSIFKTIEVFR